MNVFVHFHWDFYLNDEPEEASDIFKTHEDQMDLVGT